MHDSTHPLGGATALAAPAERATTTKTILLLDSAPVFLRFESTILERRDWRILRATTGGEALDLLDREKVDLLVMDHALPDLNGEHVIRAIRSSAAHQRLAILLVTSCGDQDAVERCMAEGGNAFLYKPVTRQALCAKVEGMLDVPVRRHVRTLVRLRVEGAESRPFFGNTVNLSAGGMLVESPIDMELGETLELRFHLPGDPRPLLVLASVVRVDFEAANGQASWGLSFEHVSDDDRRRIDAFVRAAERGSDPFSPEADSSETRQPTGDGG